jgi:diguanylate cyclase (GGDEF)-like protein/PAS domain S-box-containing protein
MASLSRPRLARAVLRNAGLAAGYALLGKLSALQFAHASPFWPAAAVAAFAALAWGWSAMPGVFVGSLAVNIVWFAWSPLGALWLSIGNVLAPMLGRWGLGRLHLPLARLWQEPRGVTAFLSWMGLANGSLSALFGVTGLMFIQPHANQDALTAFSGWAVADFCSVAMLVPALHLLWLRRQESQALPIAQPWREVLGVILASLLIWMWVFLTPGMEPAYRLGLMGLLLLPAMWSIFRFDLWVTATGLAATFILVMGATLAGLGPYAPVPIAQAIVGMELLGISMACSILLAGALQSQRKLAIAGFEALNADLERRVEERAQALEQKERSFRDLVEFLPAPAVVTEPRTATVLYANPAASELFGGGQTSLVGLCAMDHWVDAQARIDLIKDVRRMRAVHNRELVFKRLDGEVIWVLASVIKTQLDGQSVLVFAFKDFTERKRYERDLLRLAQTDPLTGLLNRRGFFKQSVDLLANAANRPVSIVLMDADHFKRVNDTHGHGTGDVVLQHLAGRMSAQLREQDVLARIGGEEFAVMLPKTGAKEAAQIAERMRQAVSAHAVRCHGLRLPMSLSLGVAELRLQESMIDTALSRADAAMYRAKQGGRNQVVCAGAEA